MIYLISLYKKFCENYHLLNTHLGRKAFILNIISLKLWRGLALIFPRCNILLFVIERYPCQSSHILAHYRTILTFIVQHGGWFGHCPNLREVVFIFLKIKNKGEIIKKNCNCSKLHWPKARCCSHKPKILNSLCCGCGILRAAWGHSLVLLTSCILHFVLTICTSYLYI